MVLEEKGYHREGVGSYDVSIEVTGLQSLAENRSGKPRSGTCRPRVFMPLRASSA